MSLFGKVVLTNAVVMLAALIALVFSPATVSHPVDTGEIIVALTGLAAVVLINTWLVRGAFASLRELIQEFESVDDAEDVEQLRLPREGEMRAVIRSYNAMGERLLATRHRLSLQRVRAQEAERARIGRELHDEIGQRLTYLLLQQSALRKDAPDHLDQQWDAMQEQTRALLDEVRALSSSLRPGALADLGLAAAVKDLLRQTGATGLSVRSRLDDPGPISDDLALATYRISQESLTNVVRHSTAQQVEVTLTRDGDQLTLTVTDDGTGTVDIEGSGVRGMRERAAALGGSLVVSQSHGTTVRFVAPAGRPPTSVRESR